MCFIIARLFKPISVLFRFYIHSFLNYYYTFTNVYVLYNCTWESSVEYFNFSSCFNNRREKDFSFTEYSIF